MLSTATIRIVFTVRITPKLDRFGRPITDPIRALRQVLKHAGPVGGFRCIDVVRRDDDGGPA
jgi:hypothetical protein